MPEMYVTNTGQTVYVHGVSRCSGNVCVVHNPLTGPWSDWPQAWNEYEERFERKCVHGFWHPDPSQLPYWKTTESPEDYVGHICCWDDCPLLPYWLEEKFHADRQALVGTDSLAGYDIDRGLPRCPCYDPLCELYHPSDGNPS